MLNKILANNSARASVYTRVILYSLISAVTAYIHSSYLISRGLSQPQIDSIYIILSIFGIIGVWSLAFKKRSISTYARILIVFSGLLVLSLLVILVSNDVRLLIPALFILLGLESPMFFTTDELLEHATEASETAQTRSIYLILQNSAWIVTPLIGFILIEKYTNLSIAYNIALFLAVGLFCYSIYAALYNKQESLKKTEPNKPFNLHILPAIYSHFVLQMFYVAMITIMPVYMHKVLGFGWTEIGVITAIALTAFPIVQLPLGRILDKHHIEKRIMPLAMIIISLSIVGFVVLQHSGLIYSLTFLFFMTRAGAAALEVSNESYIFRHIDYQHRSSIALFRSLSPLSYLFVPLFWLAISISSMQTLIEMIAGFLFVSAFLVVTMFGLRNYLHK